VDSTDDIRRLRIAALHLRGLTPIEIRVALQQSGIAGDLETVCADIGFLEAVWATEVQVKTEKRKARLLAELREARRAAWAAGKFDLVLKGLAQEVELLDEGPSLPVVKPLRLS
jgi:hypothetical protein